MKNMSTNLSVPVKHLKIHREESGEYEEAKSSSSEILIEMSSLCRFNVGSDSNSLSVSCLTDMFDNSLPILL